MTDWLTASAGAQAKAIRRGALTAEALMAATLERIAAENGALNAIVSLRPEAELMAEARVADATGPRGPLHGLPLAVKDLADAAGLPTSQGSPAFAGQVAEADSPHVARLRAGGALVIGKTNTPEFGIGSHTYNPVFGRTANPYDRARSCGGSSGGAAVALAARMVSLADGSDMMGSLRNPAGWCNIYGMRPSWGRVPGGGEGDLYLHRLSTNGPMARSPGDLALMLDVMSGPAPGQPMMSAFAPVGAVAPEAEGLRIGWLGDWGGALPMEEGILALCESALGVLDGQGALVERVAPPIGFEVLWEAWLGLRAWAQAAGLGDYLDDPAIAPHLKPEAVWEIETGRALSAMEVNGASLLRSDWYRAAMGLFERVDVLALPTAQLWPFELGLDWPKEVAGRAMETYHQWMAVTVPASLLGLPVVAVPAGFGAGGLPMGLQLIGPEGSDAMLLRLAEAYHRQTRWPEARPPRRAGQS
ncbi:MAG: amidase [Roseovarius sp.]